MSDSDAIFAQQHAETAVAELGVLFQSAVMDESYGESISIRDHMLQSAELAAKRALGDEMIAAALLHDIGWALEAPHERSSADRLEPVFGPEVAAPVRWHVEAKRYLVSRRPDYLELLSEASLHTLRQQGGAMNEAECAAFEALPGYERYLSLRYIDDAGKELEPPRSCWADYLPLLLRLATKHAGS